jgi:anthranilate 1,2-dioxygenase small subunit
MRDTLRLISQVQAAYARCIDADQLERWPDFFTEKCFYTITTADSHRDGLEAGIIWADNRNMLADRVTALREANIYERHSYRHILGQPYILEEDRDEVHSETPFLVVRIMRDGSSDLYASGRYLDKFVFDDNDQRLAQRVVVCDSSRIDTLLALPL